MLRLAPALDQSGTSRVTVTVSDGLLTSSRSFDLNVTAVNDAPTLAAIPNQFVSPNAARLLALLIDDVDSASDQLTLTALSHDTTVVPQSGLQFSGSGQLRTLSMTPTAGRQGVVSIDLQLSDGIVSASRTFKLVVVDNPHPWHNPLNSFDVSNDEVVAPLDALMIINRINAFKSGPLPTPTDALPPPFYDVSPDDFLAPSDALAVVNYLNAQSRIGTVSATAEGEDELATDLVMMEVSQMPTTTAESYGAAAIYRLWTDRGSILSSNSCPASDRGVRQVRPTLDAQQGEQPIAGLFDRKLLRTRHKEEDSRSTQTDEFATDEVPTRS